MVEVLTSTSAPDQITVSVGDRGPVIDEAVFSQLFGLGMGLAISRSIVEAVG